MLKLLAILYELDDLQRSQVVNEVRNFIARQFVGTSEFQEDCLQTSYVELVLLAVDLFDFQINASRCVHIWQLGWLRESSVGLVEVPTCSQELDKGG